MEYQILTETSSNLYFVEKEIQEKVQREIKKGWKPLGGVSITYDEDEQEYVVAQALIKE